MIAKVDMVGIGLRCVDVVIRLGAMPDWETGGRMSGFAIQGGGPAGTAMAAASRLGVRAGYIGPFGNDALGRIKTSTLARYGVDLSRSFIRNAPESQVSVVYVHESTGERVFAPLEALFHEDLDAGELDMDYISSAEYLLLDGFYPEAALAAAGQMRRAGKSTVLDMEKPSGGVLQRIEELAAASDILICGEGGMEHLTGEKDPATAARGVMAMGPRLVVETLGAKGSRTFTSERSFFTPAFDVPVVNTTGAGDVFHGAYLAGLLMKMDLKSTAIFASAVSAITCTRLEGFDRLPDLATVNEFLQSRNVDIEKPE